jgi:hypothetical protein
MARRHNPSSRRRTPTHSRRIGKRRNAEEMGSVENVGWSTLKEYGDTWKEAYWRELVQNSVDAGATKIDLYTKELNDGNIIAGCKDNGHGMTEEVFRNKFLKHGGTTKGEGSDAAGGFGAAKRLLLAPWIQWQMRSGNVVAVGQMSRHEVWVNGVRKTQGPQEFSFPPQWKNTKSIKGVIFEAVMSTERRTDCPAALSWLSKCYLPRITVTVNGKTAHARLNPKSEMDTSFHSPVIGYAIKNKSPFDPCYVLVRTVSGPNKDKKLAMFTERISNKVGHAIVLELQSHSVTYLKASRNDADGAFAWELRDLIRKLNINPRSAIRGPQKFQKIYWGPDGAYAAKARADERADVIKAAAVVGPSSSGGLDQEQIETVEDAVKEVRQEISREGTDDNKEPFKKAASEAAAKVIAQEAPIATPEQQEALFRQLVWTPHFFLYSDIDGYKVPRKYRPATMTKEVKKLMEDWVEMCRYVLVLLGCPKEFGVGYVFSDAMAAAYTFQGDKDGPNTNWLLLNPHKKFKDIITGNPSLWDPRKDEDLKWMYACAVHEATHMADGISDHDEEFTSAFTHNIAKCADGFTRVRELIGLEPTVTGRGRATPSARSSARRGRRVAVDPKQRGLFDF